MKYSPQLTQEKHDCIQSQLNSTPRKFQKRGSSGELLFLPDAPALDAKGQPRLDEDGNDLMMVSRPDMEDDNRLMTVDDWIQEALDGKLNNCMKRANPIAMAEAEILTVRADKVAAEIKAEEEKEILVARIKELETK